MNKGIGLILSALLFPLYCHAEVLNLEQAIERALKQDPRISEKQHLVDAARALLEEALGSDDIRYDVNALLGLTTKVDGGFFEADGVTPRSDRYDIDGVSGWTNIQFKIIKPLYTFGKVEHYAEAAKGNIKVKRGDVRLQRASTIYDVSRAYYGYLTARDTRYLFEDVIKRLDKAIGLVDKWLEDGTNDVRQSDLYALQSGMGLAKKFLAQARAIENIALEGMKVPTGIGLDKQLEIADDHIRPVELPEQTLEELQQMALQNRPEVKQLEAGLQARRSLVSAHKAEKRPNLYAGLAGFASYAPDRETLKNPFIYDPFNDYGATPLIGLNWQWESGVQQAHVSRAQAELDALVEKSSFAQLGIPFEVAEQYHQVHAFYDAVNELKDGSRSARRWMVSAYADFEAGLEEAEKVLAAFQGYVLIHSDYLAAVNDYNMHVVQLRNVVGMVQ